MRFIVLDIVVIGTIVVMFYFAYRSFLRKKGAQKKSKVGTFSGGPLHSKTLKFAKLPNNYQYTYSKPVAVRSSEDELTGEIDNVFYTAVYENDGEGNYEYKGSAPADKSMVYDLGE